VVLVFAILYVVKDAFTNEQVKKGSSSLPTSRVVKSAFGSELQSRTEPEVYLPKPVDIYDFDR
jgi:hypothetical protein